MLKQLKRIKAPPKNNPKNSGFTLLELLVVIVIIGVVSAIAAPSWLSFLSRQRMNAARSDLLGVLRAAQEDAQRLQQSKYVEFSSTALIVTVRNSGSTASTGGVETTLGGGEINADKFNLVASSPSSIIFDSDGRVDGNTPLPFPVKITHDDSSAQSCVIVTTLLGGLKAANDEVCENFNPGPT